MGYKGRITSITFTAALILTIRMFVIQRFGTAPHQMPLPAIILIIIGWFLGKEYDKSVYRANRDPLTGLFNRRYVLDIVQRRFSKINKTKKETAILLLDVNDFKQINDNFGHETGDHVLKDISDVLTNSFTSGDIVSRWGGDEYLIISPCMNQVELEQRLSQFGDSIKGLGWKYPGLSVSIGKAVFPTDGDNFAGLVSIADANMYRFKSYSKSR